MKPAPIPADYPQVCASICTRNTAEALEFYQKAFGATVRLCLKEPGGKVAHAEILIGSGLVMLADKYEGYNFSPDELEGKTTVVLHVYVDDVDAMIERAVAAGAKMVLAPSDQFYGDRSGRVLDPYGHVWLLASRIEDVSPEETERRAAALFGQA